MEMIGKIRRMYFRDKLSLHEITKRTGLARNTIRSWIRKPAADAAPQYHRQRKPGKLTAFHPKLEQALKADSFRAKHNRRTAKALFEQIKAEGYTGGYSAVTDFIRAWRGRAGKPRRDSSRYSLHWEKPFSSTGVKRTSSLAAFTASFRLPI